MTVYTVIDEEGRIVRTFSRKVEAKRFRDDHNYDRHTNTMEYFVKPLRVSTGGRRR